MRESTGFHLCECENASGMPVSRPALPNRLSSSHRFRDPDGIEHAERRSTGGASILANLAAPIAAIMA